MLDKDNADTQLAKVQIHLKELQDNVNQLKIRPWKFLKNLVYLKGVIAYLLNFCSKQVKIYQHFIDAFQDYTADSVDKEQKINKIWSRIYSEGNKLRELEERVNEIKDSLKE